MVDDGPNDAAGSSTGSTQAEVEAAIRAAERTLRLSTAPNDAGEPETAGDETATLDDGTR